MEQESGALYVVATPIGNLADISFRAVQILKEADLIAAEDTRHVKALLNHYGIAAKTVALHQHNEERMAAALIGKLRGGRSLVLVSDAGTPLISDPGLPLVQKAAAAGIRIVPVPGPCALIAALSVAGLPTTRFRFVGFPPRTASARRAFFRDKRDDSETWAFYEASHRIQASLQDLAAVVEAGRGIAVARELTKLHETVVRGSLGEIVETIENDDCMRKGEFVVIVAGAAEKTEQAVTDQQKKILTLLLKECSLRTAVDLAAEITGGGRKLLYQAALALNRSD